MRELTNELHKPMFKAHGKPILEHIVEGVIGAGIREIFIVTGFKAETIENYFGDGAEDGMLHIAYGRQPVQDGTGKAPELWPKSLLATPSFLFTYGDIVMQPTSPASSLAATMIETYQQMIRRFNEDTYSGVLEPSPAART